MTMSSIMNSTHHGAHATRETAPWHIWHALVLEIAGVTHDDYEPHRERAGRAYRAGEPAAFYAAELAFVVAEGKKRAKYDGEVDDLRRVLRDAARGDS